MQLKVLTADEPQSPMIEIGAVDYPDRPLEVVLDGIFTVDDEAGEHRLPGLRFGAPDGHIATHYDAQNGLGTLTGKLAIPVNANGNRLVTVVGAANVTTTWNWSASVEVQIPIGQRFETHISWSYKPNGQPVTKIAFVWDF
jgi:hypothetical protein